MIKADKLVKQYGSILAVDNVSFTVEKGEILGFLGPNGAGKSTSMKMITGFIPPTSGTASVGGHDIRERPIDAKRLFGYLPENGPLYDEMTPLEFLSFVAEMRGFSGEAKMTRISSAMETCKVEDVRHQPIETLSKGYRQRVGMAQAVLHDPPCLIMDEPTDGLDPNQKKGVRELIASMAQEKAIILSTHILEEVQAMCSRIIILAKGQIRVDETPDALRRRHPLFNAVEVRLENGQSAEARETLSKLASVDSVKDSDGRLVVVPKDKKNIEPDILAAARERQWKLQSLEKSRAPLEEVFWSLTQS